MPHDAVSQYRAEWTLSMVFAAAMLEAPGQSLHFSGLTGLNDCWAKVSYM